VAPIVTDLLERLRERKLVQWALAYAAGAFALLQGIDIVAGKFGWPEAIERGLIVALAIGFFVVLVLAWYHGERGAQRVSGTELAILALLLAIGGGALWRVASTTAVSSPTPATGAAGRVIESTAARPTPAATAMDTAAIAPKSIAVLPFENLSEEKGNQYFADGMQDLILTKLADIGDLKVVSRTSTAKYASHPEDLKTIGQQLGVANLLEGSVQKSGNQVLINVQLIDARTDEHRWAQAYTRTLDNIFGVEGEVADKIAQALNAKLTPAESAAVAKVGTHNPAALDAFLKGLYYLDDSNRTGDMEELERSVPLFKQAIAADPEYADAWAYLSLAYQKLRGYNPEGEEAARRALALDPGNAHAHTMYAFALAGKGEFDAAVAESEKAVALPSHNSSDIAGLGFNLLATGNIEGSSQVFQRAADADAHLDFAQEWAALTQAMLRNYPAARDGLRKVVARDPGNANAVSELAQIERVGFGNLDAARKALQSAATPVASSSMLSEAWYDLDFTARDYPAALATIAAAPSAMFDEKPRALYEALVYRAEGDIAKARPAFATARVQLETKLKTAPNDWRLHAALASCLAGLGRFDAAMEAAKRAVTLQPVQFRALTEPSTLVKQARVEVQVDRAGDAIRLLERLLSMPAGLDVSVEELRIHPDWDPLRGDPRFQALLKKYANTQSAPVAGGTGGD
jgi:TolB-like protein/Tfp pilus assembly protein PilF